MDHIKNSTVTENDNATVTISGEVPFAELEKERAAALKKLGQNIEIDGFRKGNIPEAVLVERLGEMAILSEMAERALAKAYPEMLAAHEIDAIGYPEIAVTKLAPGNPLGFSATVAIVPAVTLPDYQAIAAPHQEKREAITVTDEEMETATKDILRRKVAYERLQQKAAAKASREAGDLPTPESVDADESAAEPTDNELPELTDEVAATLGPFASVQAFKDKLRVELTAQKEQEVANKRRATITDALLAATPITLPEILVNAELEQFLAQMKDDLQRAQLTLEEYLSHIKKTEDELKAEWRPAAERRAKTQLILDAIATKEAIEPDSELLDKQVAALKEQYKDADEARIRTYVRTILRNDAVMRRLEGSAETDVTPDTTKQ